MYTRWNVPSCGTMCGLGASPAGFGNSFTCTYRYLETIQVCILKYRRDECRKKMKYDEIPPRYCNDDVMRNGCKTVPFTEFEHNNIQSWPQGITAIIPPLPAPI